MDINNIETCIFNCGTNCNIFLLDIGQNNLRHNPDINPKITEKLKTKNITAIKLSNVKTIDIEKANNLNQKLLLYYNKHIISLSQIFKHKNIESIYFCNFNFLLQRHNPINVPINIIYNLKYIEDFIQIFLAKNENNKPVFSISGFLGRKKVTVDRIQKDIIYLKDYGKLTSRLAILIYKICTFNFNSSEKEIGIYFSQFYNKSKPLNNKNHNIQNIKGYDINNIKINTADDPNYFIKLSIANKLIEMKGKKIDDEIIFKVTGIIPPPPLYFMEEK